MNVSKLLILAALMLVGGCKWTSPNAKDGQNGVQGEQGPRGERGFDGNDGVSCAPSVVDGCVVITCGDLRSEPICSGADGNNGENGQNGANGTGCSVVRENGCAIVTCGDSEARACDGEDGLDGISCSIRQEGSCFISWCTDGREQQFCNEQSEHCELVIGEMDENLCAPLVCDGVEVEFCITECRSSETCHYWYGEGTYCNQQGWCDWIPPTDSDDDNIADDQDNCPHHPNPNQEDMDNDRIGNACDADGDGDGIPDPDNCANVHNPDQRDSDGDGLGDACDPTDNRPQPPRDEDGDGTSDVNDNCPAIANRDQVDTDRDGLGDACDGDDDGDGVSDANDNCRLVANRDQADNDGDRIGNVCDASPNPPSPDRDNDGTPDASDNCPDIANRDQRDGDGDGIGDVCEEPLPGDACRPFSVIITRVAQTDWYGPGVGDPATRSLRVQAGEHRSVGEECSVVVSDPDAFCRTTDGLSRASALPEGGFGCRHNQPANDDADGDGIANDADNCPINANRDQRDSDRDGIGDACEAA